MNKKIVKYSKNNIYIDSEISKEYIKLIKQREKIESKLKPLEKQLKSELIETMEKLGETTFNSNGISGKLKSGYNRMTLDTDRLKEENIKLYTEYLKTSYVNSSVSISID